MNYRVDHIPKSKNRRPGTALKPQFLTIHSTGNPSSTAKNERAWLTNPSNDRTASWHIVVDQNEAIEAIPLTEVAYHAGTAAGNSKSISIEICESGNREKTLVHAAEVTASTLKKYGWGVDKLRRHFDWSGKICPRILSANNWAGWNQFKKEVEKKLTDLKKIEVDIRGKKAEGMMVDGVAYVPIRAVAEKLGARVLYKDGKVYVE